MRAKSVVDRRIADKAADQSVREVRGALANIQTADILFGRLLTVTLAATTATPIQHGLGRRAKGYIPVRMSASANIYDATPGNGDRADVLWIQSSANCTVTLWIF